MRNLRSKQDLYESIMQDVSRVVRKHLNEMKPETYDSAADKRQAQLDRLSPFMKSQLKQDQLDAPARLRQHADKIRNGYYPDVTKASDRNKLEDEIANAIVKKDYQTLKDIYDLYLKKQKTPVVKLGALTAPEFQKHIVFFTKVFGNNCNLNWLDVSNITNMSYAFFHSDFNGDISRWDVSNVTNMSYMFEQSVFNGDISKWNVSKVTNMHRMFKDSMFTGDISSWDVSNVTDMSFMFYNSEFNGDISEWDVSCVTNMSCMFKNSQFNQDISAWDVSSVQDDINMFQDCPIEEEYKPKF